MNECIVRPAVVSDAASAVAVLRDSITCLCVADHQNDPSTLQRWLQNKTADNFSKWLQDSERHFVVAELDSEVCGVGMIRNNGDLDLCYIQPGKERLGIGAAILQALEAQAALWRLSKLQLISTANARGFYEHHGYVFTGEESVPGYGVVRDYSYAKTLRTQSV
jgi:GNAT superfamily N-acetyltransferase